MIKIILWASIIWLLPFLYFVQKNEAKFKKNIVIGVTLPFEAREDEEVSKILETYIKQTGIIAIILGIAVIPCLLPKGFTWIMCLWMLWLDAVIILINIPFVIANKKLKKLKEERGWKKAPEEAEVITVDMSNISAPRWVSTWVFVIAFVITLVPLIFALDFWPIVTVMAATQVLFYVCYRFAFRTKSEAVDSNIELTAALTQVRRRYWGRVWVKSSYATAIYSLSVVLLREHSGLFLWITLAYSIYVVIAVAVPEFKLRALQEKLTKDSGRDVYIDDDDNWVWGMFYYNPRDTHLMVNSRVGVGSTMNAARPFGKFMYIFTIILLVAMPLFPFMIDKGIKSEVVFEAKDDMVIVSSGRTEYKVDLDDVESVELIYELPENLSRTWGTATEKILKGTYSAKGLGAVNVCLNPDHPPYIFVKTEKGKKYLFGTDDPARTDELYMLFTEIDR